jgi:hypothetical protein
MWDTLQNIGLLLIIPIAIWAFLPKVIRMAMVEVLHGVGRNLVPFALGVAALIRHGISVIEPVLFKLVVGKSYEQARAERALKQLEMLNTARSSQLDRMREIVPDEPDRQQTAGAAALSPTESSLQLDRTRKGIVRALLLNGWSVGQIRGTLKGDNNLISKEIEEVRSELDNPGPTRPELVGERYDRVVKEVRESTPAA